MSTTTVEPVTFTTTTGQYAHETRVIPSRPLTVSEWLDTIWTGQTTGFGETHYINELARDKEQLAAVKANRIRPERIVGRGVRKPKTSAIAYLEGSIRRNEDGLRTRGRSERINIENAEGYARKGHAAPGREQDEPKGPSPITPDPAAEAAALASWHGIDKADGGTYNWCRKREVTVCGRCSDYAEEGAIVWFDEARAGFIHRGNDSNRCPGQGDDDTDDRCDRSDVERVPADTISAASLDHWQRTGQYLPIGVTDVNGFEAIPVRVLDGETAHCSEAEATAWGVYVTHVNQPTMHVEDLPTREEAEQVAGKLAERYAVEARTLTDDAVDYASSASRQYWIETGRYLAVGEAESVDDMPEDKQMCVQCGDDVYCLSSDGKCDGCVAENDREERARALQAEHGTVGMSDQPTTCGKCGRRTEHEDLADSEDGETRQLHTCTCGHAFVVESDREWDEHDETHVEGFPASGCNYCPTAEEPALAVTSKTADDGTVTHAVSHPHGPHVVSVEHDIARVAVYLHHPEDGSAPYLVVDIDSESDDPALCVYVNDGPILGQPDAAATPAPATREADARSGFEHVHYVADAVMHSRTGERPIRVGLALPTRDAIHAHVADLRASGVNVTRLYAERVTIAQHECDCAVEVCDAYAEGYSVGRHDTEPTEYDNPWQRAEYERGRAAGEAAFEATA